MTTDYPFAFMLASAGYLLAMLADCVIFSVFRKQRSTDGGDVVLQVGMQPGIGTSQSRVQVDSGTDHYLDHSFFSARSFGDTVLLIIALCFNSVFEGIAIGVADTKANAWRALWTVSLHKVFAAISFGLALLRMIPDHPLLSCLAFAFAFSISSPIGVAIGTVIDATSQGIMADRIYAISMGIACGVLIYISINHLLYKGYSPNGTVLVYTPHHKFLAVLLGVGVIAVVMIWDK